MSCQDEDPEVAADRRLRAATEHDSSRTRAVAPAIGLGAADVVGQVACWRCRAMTPIYQGGADALDAFNAILRANGDEHGNRDRLDMSRLMVCPECRPAWETHQAERAKKRRATEDAAIATMRAEPGSPNGIAAAGLLRKIGWSAGDVAELLAAVARRKAATSTTGHGRARWGALE